MKSSEEKEYIKLFIQDNDSTKNSLHNYCDEFIDCGPPPATEEEPPLLDFHADDITTIPKLCYHTIESNLLGFMDMCNGRAQLLELIENKAVDQNNLSLVCMNATQSEINVSFLWSAFLKRWELLEEFLRIGADLFYFEPSQGLGVLHLASFSGCIPGTQFLISQGCDVNAVFKFYSPLHCVAFGDSPDTALILLNSGAKIDFLTNSPYHPFENAVHCAVRANSPSCIRIFIHESSELGQTQSSGMSPLHLAADLGHAQCLEILLESHNTNVNLRSREKKQTPLHLAAIRGYAQCIETLLEKKANPNIKNHMGQTPLHLAALSKSYECIEILLSKGDANPNFEDCDKRTALHGAVGKSSKSNAIIDVLVEHGASINKGDQYGYTPLHIAALKGYSQCVETLIHHGADVSAKTKSGMTALGIITKKCPSTFATFIKKLDSAITIRYPDSTAQELELRLDLGVILQFSHPKEIDFLNTLVDEGYKKVLMHPLCLALLYLKWRKMRKYYITRLAFSLIFVLSLSLYVLTALAHHCYNYGKNFDQMKPEDVNELCEKESIMGRLLRSNPFVIEMQWFLLVGITCCEILRKVYGIPGYHNLRQYFSYPENIIEWAVIVSVFVISFIYTGRTYTWQNHVGAFAVLLGWTNLMLMVGQLPVFGTYVAMYTRVQSQFAKLLFAYSGLLIGFALSFCVIFPDTSTFANPFISLVSIIVMMSGELNLDILVDDNPENPHFLLEFSAEVIYVIFVLTVTIILMNLLVGIAVDDIKWLQRTAGLSKLVRQTKLISHMELALFNGNVPKYFMNLLHWTALVSPRPSKVILKLKPLNPRESRIPKDIMKSAFEIAKRNSQVCQNMDVSNHINYCFYNKEFDQYAGTSESYSILEQVTKQLNNKSDELENLRSEIIKMKENFAVYQETTEQILRILIQRRRSSKCQ